MGTAYVIFEGEMYDENPDIIGVSLTLEEAEQVIEERIARNKENNKVGINVYYIASGLIQNNVSYGCDC